MEKKIGNFRNKPFNFYGLPAFYFLLGLLFSVPSLALDYFFKNTLALDQSSSTASSSIFVVPWCLKMVYGAFSDRFPLCGYRRKSYMVLFSSMTAASWLVLALPSEDFWTVRENRWLALAMLAVGSWGIAVADVMADSIMVLRARRELAHESGTMQTIVWTARTVGSVLGSVLGSLLVNVYGPDSVVQTFQWMFVPPLLMALLGLRLDEQDTAAGQTEEEASVATPTLSILWLQVRRSGLWRVALFLFLFGATPSAGSAFFYFLVNDLHFGPRTFGFLTVLGSLSSLLGMAAHRLYFVRFSAARTFVVGSLICTVLGLFQLALIFHWNRRVHISDYFFLVSEDIAASFAGQIISMPLLIMAARIVPPGSEGLMYGGLMSVSNFSSIVSSLLGAALTSLLRIGPDDDSNLWLLLLICSISSILPLPLVPRLLHFETPKDSHEPECPDFSPSLFTIEEEEEDEDTDLAKIKRNLIK